MSSFTFTTPLTVNRVETKEGERLFVEGYISTTDIDLVNDVMTRKCQESMQRQILEGNMKLDLEHEAFKGSTREEQEIAKTKVPVGKLIDATVKELKRENEIAYATRVKGEINRNHKNYKQIKGNLVEKYLDAFSVAFLPTEVKHENREGKNVRLLDDCILLNVALTGNPCNTKAQMVDVVAKSIDSLELYKKAKKENPNIESDLVIKNNSHSLGKTDETTKLNPNSKMTEDETKPETEVTGNESEDVEQKSLLKSLGESLKSMDENLKSMTEKMEAVTKENEALKEAVSANAEAIEKVTKALESPIHKSLGAAETKKTEQKSVNPLDMF